MLPDNRLSTKFKLGTYVRTELIEESQEDSIHESYDLEWEDGIEIKTQGCLKKIIMNIRNLTRCFKRK